MCCCVMTALARDEYTRDFRKSVPLPGGRSFRIEHSLGSITIRTQAKNEVEIQAAIRCQAENAGEARACADEIQIKVEESGSGVLVRTEYPRSNIFSGRRNLGYSVNYDITIPQTAPLEVRNRFGAVSVRNLHANGVINNGNGRVSFTGGRGTQRIENSFGDVEVAANDGDLTVVNGNGRVTASDISGTVDITGRFGDVRVTNAGRSLTIHDNNGNVEATNVGGAASISNSFGAVRVWDAKSGLTVQNQNGEVQATGIAGTAELHTTFAPVRFSRIGKTLTVRASNASVTGDTVGESAAVETSFGNVDVRGVKGGARVTAGNSSIRLAGIGGEVYAKTSFGGITVDDAAGPITVENGNGSVTAASKPGQRCQPVSLRTSFAPIRVTVPPDLGYNVSANTSFGRIHSEHELAVSGQVAGDALTGKIGAGGCELRLMNQNGNIEILKGAGK
jgi:DUF4097 and DUF4098 domain-containing protein YvlB